MTQNDTRSMRGGIRIYRKLHNLLSLMITSAKIRGNGNHVIRSTLVYPNVNLCKSVTSRCGLAHGNIYITPVIEQDFFIAFGAEPRRTNERAGCVMAEFLPL